MLLVAETTLDSKLKAKSPWDSWQTQARKLHNSIQSLSIAIALTDRRLQNGTIASDTRRQNNSSSRFYDSRICFDVDSRFLRYAHSGNQYLFIPQSWYNVEMCGQKNVCWRNSTKRMKYCCCVKRIFGKIGFIKNLLDWRSKFFYYKHHWIYFLFSQSINSKCINKHINKTK